MAKIDGDAEFMEKQRFTREGGDRGGADKDTKKIKSASSTTEREVECCKQLLVQTYRPGAAGFDCSH